LYFSHNAIIKDILIRMIIPFSFSSISYGMAPKEEAPFIDGTGVTGQIDYDISDREFSEMNKGNWSVALEFFHRLGFDLVKSQRLTKVVVITDPQ